MFGLGGTSRGHVLRKWKTLEIDLKQKGDLGALVQSTLGQESISSQLSIAQWQSGLDELASFNAFTTKQVSSCRTMQQVLKSLFIGRSGMEMKWMVRMLLRNVETWTACSSLQIMSAFHPLMNKIYQM